MTISHLTQVYISVALYSHNGGARGPKELSFPAYISENKSPSH